MRGENDSLHGASDTAVAMAHGETFDPHRTPGDTAEQIGPTSAPGSGTSELIGTLLLERFLVTKQIGQGGMGAVYEATHTLINKRVAVKVLLEKYAQREQIVTRLKKEATLASSIRNEHIIDITDIGNTADGRTFVVMEYLEGESLAECLAREHQLSEQRTLRIAAQAASALVAAHAKGIVHRDIKPENLFLLKRNQQDFVKVVDFGISKSLHASSEEEAAQRLTQTGMVLGTPLYMSPEQARGDEDLDHRVDVYALGVIMYEALAGRVPFAGTNYLSVISQVLNEEPVRIRDLRADVSEELEALVARAMAKDRAQRYEDASAMLRDLTALLEDPTRSTERAKITGPRRRLAKVSTAPRLAWAIAGIGVAIGGVMLVVVLLMGHDNHQKQDLVVTARQDAGTAARPDAALPEPIVEKIKLHIITDPPHAAIYRESEPVGTSPLDLELVKNNKEVHVSAQLDGYVDGGTDINPLERTDGSNVMIKLKKLARNAPPPPRRGPGPVPGAGSGSAASVPHNAGGELTGYPGHN